MKRFFTILSLGGALLVANVASVSAQVPSSSPSYSGAPAFRGAPTSTTSAPSPGSVTNQTTTTESTTTIPVDSIITETTSVEEPLANTGGEPWMFVFGGLALAGSALLMRRRVASNI